MPDQKFDINFNVEGAGLEEFDRLLRHYQKGFLEALDESPDRRDVAGVVTINKELSENSELVRFPTKPPSKVGAFDIFLQFNLLTLGQITQAQLSKFYSLLDTITTNRKLSNRVKNEANNAKLLQVFLGAHYSFFNGITEDYVGVSATFNQDEFKNETKDEKIKFIKIMLSLGFIERVGTEYKINVRKVTELINTGFFNLTIRIVAKTIPDTAKASHDNNLYEKMQLAGVNTPVVFRVIHQTANYSTSFTQFQEIKFLDAIPDLFQRPKEGDPEKLKMVFQEIAKLHKAGILHNDLRALNIGFATDEKGNPVILIDPTRGKIIPFPRISNTTDNLVNSIEIDLSIMLGMPGLMGLVKDKLPLSSDAVSYIRECIFDVYIAEVSANNPALKTKLTFSSAIFAFTEFIDK